MCHISITNEYTLILAHYKYDFLKVQGLLSLELPLFSLLIISSLKYLAILGLQVEKFSKGKKTLFL